MVQSCADNMTSENFGPASEILYQEVRDCKGEGVSVKFTLGTCALARSLHAKDEVG